MTHLIATQAEDAARLQQDLARALDGGPALALGMLALGSSDDEPEVVEDGTAVVIGTSGSSGIPKRVVVSA
ncbi:acyl-CoA synthetase, partial [Microbacterium sp. AGC85]